MASSSHEHLERSTGSLALAVLGSPLSRSSPLSTHLELVQKHAQPRPRQAARPAMGLAHREYLSSTSGKVFGCRRCRTHLTTSEQIESKVRSSSPCTLSSAAQAAVAPARRRHRDEDLGRAACGGRNRLGLAHTRPARRTSTASTAGRTSSPRCASLFAPSPSRHLARGQLTLARSSSARSVNITCGPAEDRPMTTGLHTVRDIMCAKCGEVLGWKYGALRPSPPRATSRQRLTPPRSRPQTRRTRPTRSTRRASTSSRRPSSVRRFARSPLAPALTTSTDPSRPLAADVQ